MSRLFAVFCATLLLVAPAFGQTAPSDGSAEPPTNVILMIPDGFGPASATMARDYLRWHDGVQSLALDSLQHGSVRTFAANSRITDSAAGATAYATGTKTNNGYIATDTSGRVLGTLLEAVERKDLATGLVATSRITHATPAAFSAHTPDRGQENRIAAQQITKDIEVILGGGRRHFLPETMDASARNDQRNLLDAAEQSGYQLVETANGLAQVEETPVLGLFSNSHMAYEIDREQSQQPSLSTMTETAINLLSDTRNGYFLMVEGSRIDHAGHGNDAAAHLHEILAFNDAVATALEFANRDQNTLVVVVSDHETGGLTLARNRNGEGIYAWHPEVLDNVSASTTAIADSVRALRSSDADSATVAQRISDTVSRLTGVSDISDERLRRLTDVKGQYALGKAVAPIVNRPALVGWTTYGHTAVDVNLYAYGPGANRFSGNRDNTYVGRTLADLLNVNLEQLTEQLRAETSSE